MADPARQIRRLEAELVSARSQLSSAEEELNAYEQQTSSQSRQIAALCGALSDATSASADCVANLQLAVYTYRDTQLTPVSDYTMELISLVKDVELHVDRMNESTRIIQSRLSASDVQVSTTESFGVGNNNSNNNNTMTATTTTAPHHHQNNVSSSFSSGGGGPMSPLANRSQFADRSYLQTTTSQQQQQQQQFGSTGIVGTASRVGSGGAANITTAGAKSRTYASAAPGTLSHAPVADMEAELRRLRAQVLKLERTAEAEKAKLSATHTESLSTLAVALKRDTTTAEKRAAAAEAKIEELIQQIHSMANDNAAQLQKAAEELKSEKQRSVQENTAIRAAIAQEVNNLRASSAQEVEMIRAYAKQEVESIRVSATAEIEAALEAAAAAARDAIVARNEVLAMRHEGDALAAAMQELLATKKEDLAAIADRNAEQEAAIIASTTAAAAAAAAKEAAEQVALIPVPAPVPAPAPAPLSAAGQATVQVLAQLSDIMSRFRPLSPAPPPVVSRRSRSSEGLLIADNNNSDNYDSEQQQQPVPETPRPIALVPTSIPGMGSINDTLSSLAAQISVLERTHLPTNDWGSPTPVASSHISASSRREQFSNDDASPAASHQKGTNTDTKTVRDEASSPVPSLGGGTGFGLSDDTNAAVSATSVSGNNMLTTSSTAAGVPQDVFNATNAQLLSCEAALEAANENISQLNAQIQAISDENNAKICGLQSEIESLVNANTRLQSVMLEENARRLDEMATEAASLFAQLQASEDRAVNAASSVESLRIQLQEQTSASQADFDSIITPLRQQLESLKVQHAEDLNSMRSRAESAENARHDLEAAKQALESGGRQIESLQSALESAKKTNEALKSSLSRVEGQYEIAKAEVERDTVDVQSFKELNQELTFKLNTAQEQLHQQREANQVLTQELRAAKQATEVVEAALFATKKVYQDSLNAAAADHADEEKRLAALKSSLDGAKHQVAVASQAEVKAKLLAQHEKVDLAQVVAEKASVLKQVESLTAQLKVVQAQVALESSHVHDLEQSLNAAVNAKQESMQTLASTQQELAAAIKHAHIAESQVASAHEEVVAAHQVFAEQEQRLSGVMQTAAIIESQLKSASFRIAELETQVARNVTAIAELEEARERDMNAAKESLTRASDDVTSAKAAKAKSASSAAVSAVAGAARHAMLLEAQAHSRKLQAENQSLTAEVGNTRAQLQQTQEQVTSAQASVLEARQKADTQARIAASAVEQCNVAKNQLIAANKQITALAAVQESLESDAGNMNAMRKRQDELMAEVEELRGNDTALAATRAELDAAHEEIAQLGAELDSLRQDYLKALTKIDELSRTNGGEKGVSSDNDSSSKVVSPTIYSTFAAETTAAVEDSATPASSSSSISLNNAPEQPSGNEPPLSLQVDLLRAELTDARDQISKLQETLALREIELQDAQQDVLEAVASQEASQIDEAAEKLLQEEKEAALQRASNEMSMLQAEVESMKQELLLAKQDAENARMALADSFKDLASADARILNAEMSAKQASETQLMALEKAAEDAQLAVSAAVAERESVKAECALLRAQVTELQAPSKPKVQYIDACVSTLPQNTDFNENNNNNNPDAAMTALAGGGATTAPASSGDFTSSSSNSTSNATAQQQPEGREGQEGKEGDVQVNAYDSIPALRGLVISLEGRAAAAESMAAAAAIARDKAASKAGENEAIADGLRASFDSMNSTVQALEVRARSAEARAETSRAEADGVRATLASAQALLIDCEARTLAAEGSAATANESLKYVQAQRDRAEMETRVLQTQLDLALSGTPINGTGAAVARQIEATKAATERLAVADGALRQAEAEITRLQEVIHSMESREKEARETRAAERGLEATAARTSTAKNSEQALRIAELTAQIKALKGVEDALLSEAENARRDANDAKVARDAAQLSAEGALNDAARALSSVLGIAISPEMVKTGRYPARPPGSANGNSISSNNGAFSVPLTPAGGDALAREVSAAAAQLRMVTLQKSAMAKELAQVYKAVEVLEGNLSKTRRDNKRLHEVLEDTQRKYDQQQDEFAQKLRASQVTTTSTPDTSSYLGNGGGGSISMTRGIAPGVLSAMRAVFNDYSTAATAAAAATATSAASAAPGTGSNTNHLSTVGGRTSASLPSPAVLLPANAQSTSRGNTGYATSSANMLYYSTPDLSATEAEEQSGGAGGPVPFLYRSSAGSLSSSSSSAAAIASSSAAATSAALADLSSRSILQRRAAAAAAAIGSPTSGGGGGASSRGIVMPPSITTSSMSSMSGSAGYRPQSIQPHSQTSLANAANAAGGDGSRYYGKPELTRRYGGRGYDDDDDNSSSNSSNSFGSSSNDFSNSNNNNNNTNAKPQHGGTAAPLSVSPIKPSGGSSSDARQTFFMNR